MLNKNNILLEQPIFLLKNCETPKNGVARLSRKSKRSKNQKRNPTWACPEHSPPIQTLTRYDYNEEMFEVLIGFHLSFIFPGSGSLWLQLFRQGDKNQLLNLCCEGDF